ncbi:MAG TPA: endonuclease III [Anaerolineaceae bacterium]|nr:endonuclease III [Anaerolineaceae bacterium]HQJ31790.1 endonuclease III [Anaerolineaceae bacterium]
MDQIQEHRARLVQVQDRLRHRFGTPTWHVKLPAVDELVCTILSQNTNDINRDKAFKALKERYPNWEAVRDADPAELRSVIRIAGLANQKGPNIQAALRDITEERGEIDLDWLKEKDPEEARKWLVKLRGVGPKTAAIVMVFALGMPAFPVDTHIYRVTGRIGLRPRDLDISKTHAYMEQIADPDDFGSLHLNLINLGREICQARKPKCPICPIIDLCQYEDKTE